MINLPFSPIVLPMGTGLCFLSQYQSIRDSFLIDSDVLRFSTPGELSLTQSQMSWRSVARSEAQVWMCRWGSRQGFHVPASPGTLVSAS